MSDVCENSATVFKATLVKADGNKVVTTLKYTWSLYWDAYCNDMPVFVRAHKSDTIVGVASVTLWYNILNYINMVNMEHSV